MYKLENRTESHIALFVICKIYAVQILSRFTQNGIFLGLEIRNYAPSNHDLWKEFIWLSHLKQSALEWYRRLIDAYSKHIFGRTQSIERFNKFKSSYFLVRIEQRGRHPKKLQDDKFATMLFAGDGQTQEKFCRRTGRWPIYHCNSFQRGWKNLVERWVVHELTERHKET